MRKLARNGLVGSLITSSGRGSPSESDHRFNGSVAISRQCARVPADIRCFVPWAFIVPDRANLPKSRVVASD
jgi:hypothetical protein